MKYIPKFVTCDECLYFAPPDYHTVCAAPIGHLIANRHDCGICTIDIELSKDKT